jgi:hypothetical protein
MAGTARCLAAPPILTATAGKEPTMADIVFLLASVVFFAAFIGMAYFFERARKYK